MQRLFITLIFQELFKDLSYLYGASSLCNFKVSCEDEFPIFLDTVAGSEVSRPM